LARGARTGVRIMRGMATNRTCQRNRRVGTKGARARNRQERRGCGDATR
jgi:hypothetical protein